MSQMGLFGESEISMASAPPPQPAAKAPSPKPTPARTVEATQPQPGNPTSQDRVNQSASQPGAGRSDSTQRFDLTPVESRIALLSVEYESHSASNGASNSVRFKACVRTREGAGVLEVASEAREPSKRLAELKAAESILAQINASIPDGDILLLLRAPDDLAGYLKGVLPAHLRQGFLDEDQEPVKALLNKQLDNPVMESLRPAARAVAQVLATKRLLVNWRPEVWPGN